MDQCSARIPGLRALILHGGYGRDEGGWMQASDGAWKPYNDFDLVAILDDPLDPRALDLLKKELAQRTGISWVDIVQMTARQLKGLRPTIFNYDLKYATKVIYGDPKVLDDIPPFEAQTLPTVDILTLFTTRLWTFLGSLGDSGLTAGLAGEELRLFRNQMAKALMACVDTRLLLRGAYHFSYAERVNRALNMSDVDAGARSLFKWALEEKLQPKATPMSAAEITALYNQAHTMFMTDMQKGLSIHFGRQLATIEDIARAYLWNCKTVLKRLLYPVVRRSMRFERTLTVNLAQMFIFGAYSPDGEIVPPLLARGAKLLQKLDSSLSANMDWDQARQAAARLRMAH